MGRGELFTGATARIALLVVALAVAMFLPVRDGVAGESDRALLPPVAPIVVACEEGECPSVALCEPGSVWDARARTCRQVSFCPGDRKVQIPGGPCELYCRPGTEANPFDPNRCRPVVSCPQGTTEKADGVCEIACPDGRRENPYAPGTCRPAFFCPEGQEEVAGGECAARCGEGEERDLGGECRPIPPSAEFCARSGMAYDSGAGRCLSFSLYCPLIEKIHEPFANRCVANPEICQRHGLVYILKHDRCLPPADSICRQAGMFFHVNQCVSVDPASCPAMGRVYDSENDQCIADAEICGEAGLIYDSENDQCIANAEICGEAGLIYISTEDKCFKITGRTCSQAGMSFDSENNRCLANEESCHDKGRIYDSAARRCAAPSAENCVASGQLYAPDFGRCVATCREGTEQAGNECLNVCRNNDHNGRFFYDQYARFVVSSPAGPVTRTGLCVCPPGADRDECRELNRSHGAAAVKLHFARSLTLANGEFLLGQGVSVGVMESGPLQWWDRAYGTIRTHSDLPSVKIFCSTDEQGNKVPCYDDRSALFASHGIAVLGVMAAQKDGAGLVGIAPESDYLYAWLNYNKISMYANLVTHGASIINNSWSPEYYIATHDFRPRSGACGAPEGTPEKCFEQTRANLQSYARRPVIGLGANNLPTHGGSTIVVEVNELFTTYDHAARQVDGVMDPADRPIYVRSAGNNNGRRVHANITVLAADGEMLTVFRENSVITATSLASIAGLPYYFSDMTLNNLAVAAVDEFDQNPAETVVGGVTLYQPPIARFSNPCGEGALSFCLAAPGVADYEYGDAEYAELARQFNYDCELVKDSNGRLICRDSFQHNYIITYLLTEKFKRGWDSGFLLAPERYGQRERRLTAGYDVGAGTSFAAPMVSGALALMKSYFMLGTDCGAGGECGLGSHELVGRILATADRRGIYADASIYGSGLLDLKNALTPQGELRLLLGRSVRDSSSHLLSQSGLRLGAALGDSALRALSGVRLAAFDALNAPFPVFGDAVLSADDSAEEAGGGAGVEGGGVGEALRAHQSGFRGRRRPPASDWDFEDGYGFLTLRGGDFLSSWGAGEGEGAGGSVGGSMGGSVGGSLGAVGFGNPYSALVGDGMVAGVVGDGFRLAAFGEGLGSSRRIRGAFAEFSLASFSFLPEGAEGAGLSFQVGGMEELDGLLDTSGAGVFGRLRARTAFAGLGFSGELPGGWRVRAGGFAGRTAAEDGSGWLSPVEDLWSGAYALGLERDNVLFSGDALGFRVHQPLRASGGLRLRVPTGRTRYGDLTWREVSGAPSGRELIWEGLYRRSSDEGDWLLSAGVISQPGHRADAKALGRMLLAFERAF